MNAPVRYDVSRRETPEVVAILRLTQRDVEALYSALGLADRHDSCPAQACDDWLPANATIRLRAMATSARQQQKAKSR